MKKLLLIMFLVSAVMGQANHTGWPLELLSWNVNKAYPGIEYNYRLGVKGGEYPYRFYLRHGPEGMIVDSTGALIWTPASATTDSVRVVVKDQLNDSLVVEYGITATTSGFYFIATTGDNANAGDISNPFATMEYAITNLDSSAYVYIRGGTYEFAGTPISSTGCGRFISYPGETVNINSMSTGNSSISLNGGDNGKIFQGLNFDGNAIRWIFNVAAYTKNVIWRKNTMHHIYSTDSENPGAIFFANGGANPITGGSTHSNIVIQDNIFYDIGNSHSASVQCFDVKNLLYENNIAHDIEGRAVNDKDMGYMNTIRGNLFYDCFYGIHLESQGGQSNIEVCYNHIYKSGQMRVGVQSGYINKIFIHHNTIIGSINFHVWEMLVDSTYNLNVYKNILGKGTAYTYDAMSGDSNYMNTFSSKVSIDSNIVYGLSNGTNVAGGTDGVIKLSWTQWQSIGYDLNSKYIQLTFDSSNVPLLNDTLLSIYGHLSYGVVDTTVTPIDTNNSSLRYRVITNGSLISESDTTFVYQIDLSDSISSIDAAIDSSKQISVTNSSGVNLKRVAHYVSGTSCSVYWLGRKRASQADTFYIEFGTVTEDSIQTFTADSITDYYSFENITADSVKNDASGLKRRQYGMTSADTIFGSGVAVPAYSRLVIPGSTFSAKTNFTINMYAAFTSFASNRDLFTMNSGTNSMRMHRSTNGKYYLNIGTNSWYGVVVDQPLDVNTPYMYTIVYNGSGTTNYDKLKLYINNDTATISYDGPVDAQMPDFLTATFTFSSESYATTGVIDEAMISSDSKSSGWVVDRYNMINNDQFYSVETALESEPVLAPPVITMQPHDSTVTDGDAVSFSVTATNATGYQWYGNGSLISGATSSTYSFTSELNLNGSSIYCLVYNATDTISTDTVTLTVIPIPLSANTKLTIGDTFKPRYTADETVISNFDGGVGVEWVKTAGLGAVDEMTLVRNGTKSIRVTGDYETSTTTTISKALISTSFNDVHSFVLTFHLDDSIKSLSDSTNVLLLNFVTSGWTHYYYKEYSLATVNSFDSGWYKLQFNKNTLASFGAPDWGNITSIRISLRNSSNSSREIVFDQLSTIKNPVKGGIVFWFDTCMDGIYNYGRSIFDRYGFKFTESIKAQYVGTGDIMSLAQLKTIQQEGHDLVSYPWDPIALNTLTPLGIDTQLTKIKTYMINNGFEKWKYLAFSQGTHNRVVDSIALSKGFEWFRGATMYTVGGAPLLQIPQYSNRVAGHYTYLTQSIDTLKAVVDTAIKYNIVVPVLFHGIKTYDSLSIIDTTKLVALLDYCNTKVQAGTLDVKRISDYFIGPPPTITLGTDTLKLVVTASDYDSLRWFHNGIPTDSTGLTYTIYADSAWYASKSVIYCMAYNVGGSTKSGEWVFGATDALINRWSAFKGALRSAYKRAFR